MTTLPTDPILGLALTLVASLEIQAARLSTPPAKVGLRIGTVGGPVFGPNEDECCEGLAWVRPTGATTIGEDPSSLQSELRSCGPYGWLFGFELGVARCMAFGAGATDLDPIVQEDWDTAAGHQAEDFAAMVAAVQCAFPTGTTKYKITQWQPQEIAGGCQISTLVVDVLSNWQCALPC